MTTLDKEILEQTLRGYAEVNAITAEEGAAALARLTSAESWAAFEALYKTWKRTGQTAGGDWAALAEQRLADAVALRTACEAFARRKGLPGYEDELFRRAVAIVRRLTR